MSPSPADAGLVPRLSGYFVMSDAVAEARTVYESLGWRSARTDHLFVPFALGGSGISLWDRAVAGHHLQHARDAGIGFHDVVLGIVLEAPEDVDAAIATARGAGATVITEPMSTAFGRSAWFADPAGTCWEVCWIDGVTVQDPWTRGLDVDDACHAVLVAVTIAHDDVDGLREFYERGLGWTGTFATGSRDVRFALQGAELVLRPAGDVVAEVTAVGLGAALPLGGVSPALAVDPARLDDALAVLSDLGATLAQGATIRADGSVVGWLTDPNGVRWELLRSPG